MLDAWGVVVGGRGKAGGGCAVRQLFGKASHAANVRVPSGRILLFLHHHHHHHHHHQPLPVTMHAQHVSVNDSWLPAFVPEDRSRCCRNMAKKHRRLELSKAMAVSSIAISTAVSKHGLHGFIS